MVLHEIKIHAAFIPIFTFSAITSFVFLAGLFQIMPEAVNLIFYIGLLLCGRYAYLFWNKKYVLEEIAVPSTVMLVVLTVLFMFLLKGLALLHYDNFSHWGLIIKEMFDLNSLPDDRTVIQFKNYPPGSAVFIYFINKIIGYSESHALMAQGFLVAANLAVLLVYCNWKKPSQILLSIVSGFTLLIVIKANIYNLLVDTLLGLVAVSITVIAYYYRKNWLKSLIATMPILILLLLVKDSGKIFFIFNIALLLWFVISYESKKKTKALVFVTIFAIFIPLFTSFLWGEYTDKAYPNTTYEDNKFAVTLDTLSLSGIDKSEEAISNLGPDLLQAATKFDANSNVESLFWLNSISILFIIGIYLHRREKAKLLISTTVLINVFYAFYIAALYLMYLFLMPEIEMVYLAGFYRYHSTIVIYCIGLLMTALIQEWSKSDLIQKHILLKLGTMICLITVFVFPFHEHIKSITTRPEVANSLRMDLKNAYDKIRYRDSENPTVLYYSSESQGDRGYLRNMVLYEMLSWRFHITYKLDGEEAKQSFLDEMKKSDYIIVLDTDKNFKSFFSTYVDSNNIEGVYKVNNSDNGLTTVPVH
ncbi:hypothetical protein ACFOEL_10520 [Virgibacillus litoralis]